MDTNKKIANVRISPELLINLLCLPADTLIVNAFWDGGLGGNIVIALTQNDLPDIPEGGLIPYMSPVMRKNREVEFVEWVPG